MLLIVVLVTTAIMLFVMTRTSHGRYLYAIGGNPEAASASGINVKRQVFVNYIIMGLMCALCPASCMQAVPTVVCRQAA